MHMYIWRKILVKAVRITKATPPQLSTTKYQNDWVIDCANKKLTKHCCCCKCVCMRACLCGCCLLFVHQQSLISQLKRAVQVIQAEMADQHTCNATQNQYLLVYMCVFAWVLSWRNRKWPGESANNSAFQQIFTYSHIRIQVFLVDCPKKITMCT